MLDAPKDRNVRQNALACIAGGLCLCRDRRMVLPALQGRGVGRPLIAAVKVNGARKAHLVLGLVSTQ
jgi:hypothetical protein